MEKNVAGTKVSKPSKGALSPSSFMGNFDKFMTVPLLFIMVFSS